MGSHIFGMRTSKKTIFLAAKERHSGLFTSQRSYGLDMHTRPAQRLAVTRAVLLGYY